MKKIFLFIFLIVSFVSYGQTYNPANFTVSNKSYGVSQAVPTDARSQYYDAVNFVMRDYQSVSEVNTYLNLAKYRTGHFLIYIHNGGSLSAGVWTGGTTDIYIYKDGVADGDLIPFPTGSGGITGLTGDVTASGTGSVAATIANNAVSNAKFRQSAGLSIVGRTSNSTGDIADITAGTSGHVLRRNGTTLDFGTIDSVSVPTLHSEAYYNTKYPAIGSDSVYVKPATNTGTSIFFIDADTLKLKRFQAGTNVTLTSNADSSLSISSTTYTPPSAYGLLYSQNTWASLGDFVRTGGAWGTSGGKIICSGGVNDFSRFLVIDYSSLTRWKLSGQWLIATPSSTTYGIGLGQQSINPNGGQPGLAMKVDVTNGANAGKVYIYGGEGMGVKATSTSVISYSAGDKILVSIERNYDTVTAIAKNITTNASEVVLNYYYPQPTSGASLVFTPNTGEIGLINYGGSHTVDSIAWFTQEAKYSDLMLIGDSKIDGLYAQTWGGRIGEQLNKYIPSLVINSGSYDQTTQTISALNDIVRLQPKQVLMTRMSNDARYGLSLSTTLSNLARIKDSVESYGGTIYFGLFPENPGTNQTNQLILLDTLNDIYPGKVLNTMGDLINKPGSIYVSDGVHLSEYGNNEAVKSILGSGKLSYARPDVYERYVRKDNPVFSNKAIYVNKPYLTTSDSLSIPYKLYVDSLVAAATSGGASTPYLDSVLAKGGRLSANRTSIMGGYTWTRDSVGGDIQKMQDFAFSGLQDKAASWTLRHQTGTSGGQGYILTDYYNYTGGVIRFNALGSGYYNAGDFTFGSTTDFGAYSLQNSGALYQQGAFRLGGTRVATSNDVKLLVKGESDSTVAQLDFPIVQTSYSPTKTDVTNIGTASVTTSYYQRTGNKIEVWGEVTIDPTATGDTQITLSLPIASSMSNSYDLSGSAVTYDNNQTFRIYFGGGNAIVRGNASVDASSHTYSYRYVYYYFAP